MHLVDEQHGALARHAELRAGLVERLADVLDAGGDGRQLDEPRRRGVTDDVASVVLPVPGGPHRNTSCRRPAAGFDQPAQRRARAEQVLLADDLVEGARPHPGGERRDGRHRVRRGVVEQAGALGRGTALGRHAPTLTGAREVASMPASLRCFGGDRRRRAGQRVAAATPSSGTR